MSYRDLLYRYLRVTNDIRAVRKGRIWQRLFNRFVGKVAGRFMR